MSPSWRDRLLIGLAPGQVAAVHVRRGWRPVPTVALVRECPVADEAVPPWAGPLDALEELLSDAPAAPGGASVALSGLFVRFCRVPWTDGVFAARDRLAIAVDVLRLVYGDAVDGWQVALDSPRFGRDCLAAAVDRALVDGLRALLARRGLRLSSLQPHLTACFNRLQPKFAADEDGFMLVEPGCVSSLFRRDEQWSEASGRRFRQSDEAVQIARQAIDAVRVAGGAGRAAWWAPGHQLEGVDARHIADDAPWPEDPWRSMAWSLA